MRRLATALTVAMLAIGLLAAPAVASDDTIVDTFVGFNATDGGNNFDILQAIVENDTRIQGVLNGVSGDAPATVLAPNDRAFTSFARELVRKGVLDGDGFRWWQIRSEGRALQVYLANGLVDGPLKDIVFNIVAGHVVAGVAATSDIVFADRRGELSTLNGELDTFRFRNLIRDSSNRFLRVNAPDALVADGVIVVHGINRVILPAGTLG